MGLVITSNKFGSKHDIHVSVASEPGTGGTGIYLNAGSDAAIRNVGNAPYALINSDLTNIDGKLSANTSIVGDASTELDVNSLMPAGVTASFLIELRNGENLEIEVDDGMTMQNLVDSINLLTATNNLLIPSAGLQLSDITAIYDETTGAMKIVDNTTPVGTHTFKISNVPYNVGDSDAVGVASLLGIYGEVNGSEINGVRISNTRDYILNVTDPNGATGVLFGSYGDRSTYFEGIESTSPVVSSGIDPDRTGPEKAGKGGLTGISFSLEERQLDQGGGQNRFSILAEMGSLQFQIGPNKGMDHRLAITVNDMSSKALQVKGLDISTQSKAQEILDSGVIDNAINTVSLQRGALGAVQNRLDHTVKNLSVTKENLQSGESRIRDVDVAEETLEFTRNQILSQAGTAMLAQANQIPQGVMQLIGG
jgi:flagellin-like hook-associated protein FlgL